MIEETEKNENLTVLEKIKIDKSYLNYHKIIEKRLPYKFSYLDEWLLKNSKILLKESEHTTPNKYRVYKRGTIIKVDFGVNLGSEMSQVHFAIVLNNYDNPKNNVLTVIPLTSKGSKHNLYLKTLIIDELVKKIEYELEIIQYDVKNDEAKCEKLRTLLNYYNSHCKATYACCSLITTISKDRIFLPINEYDIIGRTRCSSEVMEMIDSQIIERFTKN